MNLAADFTTVIAVDNEHLPELIVSHASWVKNCPALTRAPMILVCDAAQGSDVEWRKRLSFIFRHQLAQIAMWEMPDAESQREKMLTSLIHVPAKLVSTTWYLKLDTDTVATHSDRLYEPEWFSDDIAFISSPWSYTKPPAYMEACAEWANRFDPHRRFPRPAYSVSEDRTKAYCKRIISYLFFGNTAWTQNMSNAAGMGRLPCPSQDTFAWYFAELTGAKYRKVRFKHRGWSHGGAAVREYARKNFR